MRIKKLLFFQFLLKMSKQITIKYYLDFCVKEPYQDSEDAAGCDVFAAETETKISRYCFVRNDLAIPSGFYGKIFPRSGILREHLVTVDAGLIDSDFRRTVAALLFNHHREKTFTVRAGNRIAQVVFLEKFTANFSRVADKHLLGITKRVSDGFGSTGVSVIKKKKLLKHVSKFANHF